MAKKSKRRKQHSAKAAAGSKARQTRDLVQGPQERTIAIARHKQSVVGTPPQVLIQRRALLWKLAAAIGIVLLAQAGLWAIRQELVLKPASLSGNELAQWPLTLPGWQGERTSLDEDVVRHSGADAMGTWLYQNRLGEHVLAHAGVWAKYEASLPHPPELCYAGSGYRLLDSREVKIATANRSTAHAMLYRFEGKGRPVMVLAWYQFGDETLLNRNELRGLLQRVRSGSGILPPAIKVMLQCRAEDPVRAEEQLLEVANLLRMDAAPLQTVK